MEIIENKEDKKEGKKIKGWREGGKRGGKKEVRKGRAERERWEIIDYLGQILVSPYSWL